MKKRRPEGSLADFPGSFDPITNGHLDIVDRGLAVFERLRMAILMNPEKEPLFTIESAWRDRRLVPVGVLGRALDRRGRVVAMAAGSLVVGVAGGAALDRDVLPDVDQGGFTVRLELPRGTPIERTAEFAEAIEATLRGDPGVETVFSRVGRQGTLAGLEDEESGLNTAALEVRLAPGHATRDVVERIRMFDTLEAALADCVLAVAMTARERSAKRSLLRPRVAAEVVPERTADGPVAVVFGREDKGPWASLMPLTRR